MNIATFNTFAALLLTVSSAWAGECGSSIRVKDVKSLPDSITLGELSERFGAWCQGHGPFSWYRSDGGTEIWFWWEQPKQPATSDAEGMKYRVLMALVVKADDPDAGQEIVWPRRYIGRTMCEVLKSAGTPCAD